MDGIRARRSLTKRPNKKSQNVTNACGVCRKLKIRCDGKQPCVQCKKRGELCKYFLQAKRGPKKLMLSSDDEEENSPGSSPVRQEKEPQEDPLVQQEDNQPKGLEHYLSDFYEQYVEPSKKIPRLHGPTLSLPATNSTDKELNDLFLEDLLSYNPMNWMDDWTHVC
jgi:hypothetical protein